MSDQPFMPPIHIMLDLETMGRAPGSAIASIGAVAFDEEGINAGGFYREIDLAGQDELGLRMEGETVAWWLRQDATARAAVAQGGYSLPSALIAFSDWIISRTGEGILAPQMRRPLRLWCCGPDFDAAILAAAYRACRLAQPWGYSEARDYRGLMEAAGLNRRAFSSQTPHHALHDAIAQAEGAIAAFARLPLAGSCVRPQEAEPAA